MDFDGKEGKGLTHPVKEGQSAVGWAGEDATEGKEFGREKAVSVSQFAGGIRPAKPSLSRDAVDAPGVGEEGGVGVRAQ
jgi:hypothetical protein